MRPRGYAAMGEVNYWATYSPVVNLMSISAMLTLSILRELHTKSVDFFLSYTQADVKTDIFMELNIDFLVKGDHPRECLIRLDKKTSTYQRIQA